MTTTRKQLEKNIERSHDRLVIKQEFLGKLPIELVSDAFPQGCWSEWWSDSYEFTLPLSFQLIADVLEFIKQQGWEARHEHNLVWDSGDAGKFYDVYLFPEQEWSLEYFHLAFRSNKEGSTCALQQIGVKEVPVWEVTCADAAEENTWE